MTCSVVLSVMGCATMQHTVDRWFGRATPTPTPALPTARTTAGAALTPRVYYAGADEVPVYEEPSAASTVVGTLSLHEKVRRFKVQRGYAYVEAAKGGVKGWVRKTQLVARLPSVPPSSAPTSAAAPPEEPGTPTAEETPEEAPPVAEEAEATMTPETARTSAPPPTPTPVPASPPASQRTPGGVAPSIFDAY